MRKAGGRQRGCEHGDEHAEPERAAELVRDVDEPGRSAGILGRDAGDTGGRQRPERERRPETEDRHRYGDAGDVRRVRPDAAEPRHACECDDDAAGEDARVAEPCDKRRHGRRRREHHHGQRQERDAGLDRAEAFDALQVLRQEEELPEYRADEQDPRDVGADALAAREQPQRRDRLRRVALVEDERRQQDEARRERRHREALAPAC